MQKYPLEKVVLIILQSQRGEAFLLHKFALKSELGGLIGINDTWLRFRDQRIIESQDELDSMQYSGIYLLSQNSKLEYVRNCVLVVIGQPRIKKRVVRYKPVPPDTTNYL